ncbi:MAG: hypothetical protein HYU63_06860, partial [Armatimonadetes bacterium]|nr:hypothetical protein [Armatimonadota bacterium]
MVKNLNPEALIIEGTRIKEETKDDEEKVKEVILKLANLSSGLVLVDFGWKDITRFETIEEVALKTKRTFVISPKLAYLLYNLKINLNSNVKVYLKRRDSLLYSLSDYSDDKYLLGYLLDWGEKSSLMKQAFESRYEEFLKPALAHFYEGIKAFHIKENPQKYILMLNFFELNELFDLKPQEGSIYIKASSEPFNDEMKIDQKKLKNWLKYFKIKAYLEKDLYGIHASGHASGLD